MEEVLKFLTENTPFYVATVDGDTPKVRPFGFIMNYEGKLCFCCTSNQKNVYKQLKANPKFEISATSKSYQWIRLKGKAVFITSPETIKAAMDQAPNLRNLCSEDEIEIFYADEAEATFYTMNGDSRSVKL